MRYITFIFLLLTYVSVAQPVNDNCSDALSVNLSQQVDFQTLGATQDGPAHPGLPCFSFGDSLIHHDVWYTFTPVTSEFVEWTTCNTAEFDTRLAIYSDQNACAFSEIDLIYCNDDGVDCSGFTSYLYFEVEAGETYYLRLGGFQSGDFGAGSFILNPIPEPMVPANSNCTENTFVGVITPEQADDGEGWKTGTTVNAIQELTVEDPDCVPQGEFFDVWYSFQNGENDSIEIRFETLTEDALFNIQIYDECGQKSISENEGGSLLDVCFMNNDVSSGSMWLIGFSEPGEYVMQVSTQITNQIPGSFRFQLVGQTEAVSVNEINLSQFIAVYPNPATNAVQISSPLREGVIELMGLNGKKYNSQKFNTSSFELDISTISPGIYILQINNQEKVARAKIIIK